MECISDTTENKVQGLNIGADDYIVKPFILPNLLARIEAVLRRVRGMKNREVAQYKIGKFLFDTKKQILSIGNNSTALNNSFFNSYNKLSASIGVILIGSIS